MRVSRLSVNMSLARRISWILALLTAMAMAQEKRESPRVRTAAPIDARLRELAARSSRVQAMIVLVDQPQHDIWTRQARSAERDSIEARLRTLTTSAELRKARDEWNQSEVAARRAAFAEIETAVQPSQSAVIAALELAGGRARARYLAVNMIAADLPSRALDALAAHPQVAEIFPLIRHETQLQNSVPDLGAPTFWNAGFIGAGQSVAVLDTGVRTNHPALAGLTISSHIFLDNGSQDTCFGDNATSAEDQQGHGTHVAGIVASRGSSDCPNCRGVARGLGTLYNVKIGYLIKSQTGCVGAGGGSANSGDVFAAIEYLARNTPVRIFNYSYGSPTTQDDDPETRVMDRLADTFNLLPVIASGNSGPGANTVNSPGIGQNGLTVANWTARGTISNSSSRGPTVGGRSKPDIAAPGSSILSLAHNWDSAGVNDYITRSGTSMATPHIAGSAVLLTEAGVNDPLAIRAILLNSTDNPGWTADSGWGFANLDRARNQLFYQTGSVTARNTPGSYVLYRVGAGNSLRATLTWNRHIVNGNTSIFHDLDLLSYDTATNASLAAGGSAGDNVEQLFQSGAGDYVVKARMYSTALGGGLTREKFAVAFSESNVAVAAGPRVTLTCAVTSGPVIVSSSFTLNCTASNTGDLPAFGLTGTLVLPNGFTGATALNFGDVSANATRSLALALTAAASTGTFSGSLSAQSISYEESFSASGTYAVTINPAAPAAPSSPSPSDLSTNISATPTLTWTAPPTATSYDIYFGTSASPALINSVTTNSYTPGALDGETTYYWRIGARNSGGVTLSPIWSFTTQIVLITPGAPSPANAATGIAVTPALTWSAAATGSTYDLYFGTTANPPLAATLGAPSFSPGNLSAGTTYHWRIVAKKGSAIANSPTWSFTTTPKALGLNPPTLISATPASALGSPQLLNYSIRDYDGFDNINRVFFLIHTAIQPAAFTCYGYYDRPSNGIYLYNDALTATIGPLTPGAAATIQNSQCLIDGATSALVAASGVDLSVRLGVSLKGSFAAAVKNLYVSVTDNETNTTVWTQTGAWATMNLNRPPSLVSVSPASATGSPQTFTLLARDPDGFDNLNRIYFLVNTDTTIPQNSCHGFYDRLTNSFALYNDALTSLSTTVLQNSQCSIDSTASGVLSGSGSDLNMRLTMSLKGAYAGVSQKLYFWVVDYNGNGTGWIQSTTWGPANLNRSPTLLSSSPSVVTASTQTLTLTAHDDDGAGNLSRTYFLIQSSSSIATGTCHGFYDRALNAVYLYNDSLTALLGPLSPGATGTLQNSQCALDGLTATISPTEITLTVNATLKSPYSSGLQRIYYWVTDAEGNGTGWVQSAVWTVNTSTISPSVVSVSPSSPLGSPQVFTLVGRSPAGASNINRIYFLVNNSATVQPNTCHGFYDRPGNYFVLYNDALTAALGPLTSTLQNSQCALDGAASGATSAGTDLTVHFGLSVKGTLATAPVNVYFWVQDNFNNGTGWVQTSTWTPLNATPQAPTLAFASPTTATGATQSFTVTARDSNGYADIQRIYFVVNPTAYVPANSCHGFYDRPTNALYLYNDALTALTGPITPGAAATLQNSQCLIEGATSSIAASGTDIILTLGLTRKSTLAATAQKLFVWITDSAGLGTGWVPASQWNP